MSRRWNFTALSGGSPLYEEQTRIARFRGHVLDVIVQGAERHVVATFGALLREASGDALRRPEVRPEQDGQWRVVPVIATAGGVYLRLNGRR